MAAKPVRPSKATLEAAKALRAARAAAEARAARQQAFRAAMEKVLLEHVEALTENGVLAFRTVVGGQPVVFGAAIGPHAPSLWFALTGA